MQASLPAVVFAITLLGGLAVLATAFESQTSPQAGGVQVASEPPQAELILDGKTLGKAPLTLQPARGLHRLEFRLEGYASAEVRLEWKSGEVERVQQRLKPVPATLSVKELNKAKLHLGPGVPQSLNGPGPWKLAPGSYELTASRGKVPAKPKRFELKPGQNLEIALDWPTLPVPRLPMAPPRPRSAPQVQTQNYTHPSHSYVPPQPHYQYYQPPARPRYRPSRQPEILFTPVPPAHYDPPAPAPRYPPGPEPVFTPLP